MKKKQQRKLPTYTILKVKKFSTLNPSSPMLPALILTVAPRLKCPLKKRPILPIMMNFDETKSFVSFCHPAPTA